MIRLVAAVTSGGITLMLMPFVALMAATAVAAARRAQQRFTPSQPSCQRFIVLIPAHNEASVISATVTSVRQQSLPATDFKVVVIADNCSDRTAANARAAGAEVLERTDLRLLGKGQALRWGLETLFADPRYDWATAVVIVDADTRVDSALLAAFAPHLDAGRSWLQGYYQGSNRDSSWRTRLMVYALALFNGVWLEGQEALGASVALRGNGMCFSREALTRVPWQAFGLAEDLEFSWRLRLRGERAHFVSAAKVFGELVSSGGASVSQRQRWEHGRRALRTLFRASLLAATELPLRLRLMYLVDLYMPPLAQIVVSVAIAMALALGSSWLPLLYVQAVMLAVLIGYGLSPIFIMGVSARSLGALIHLPTYVLWKFRLSFKKRPSAWVRTMRESEHRT